MSALQAPASGVACDTQALLDWAPWIPLAGCWRGGAVPSVPGLYRVRRVGRRDLDYLGQTGAGGMTLRRRLGMLRGVYADVMPYRDPHTAGPALWAIRHRTAEDFEVSVVPVVGTTPWRKGLECLAIGLHRREHGRSPHFNFGRMPAGYGPSSGNNARLVAAGKRLRGGPSPASTPNHEPGRPPVGPLEGDPQGPGWCGHPWSPWLPIAEAARAPEADGPGLYRIRRAGADDGLLYIGQGRVRARLAAHMRKGDAPGHGQAPFFAGEVEASWVPGGSWLPHQRLELENDLIAAHLIAAGRCPAAQFLG